ncbi:Uncharacterised protein [uncultured archaeon]|nr:Uncharacterised protein [uncultured archaeon]
MIEKMQENFKQKIQDLKNATKDNLFFDDLKETSEDFRTVDLEGWEEERLDSN